MNLNKINMSVLSKGASYINARYDYLRILTNEPFEYFEHIMSLLTDNSCDYYDDEYSYTKITSGNGDILKVSFSYEGISVPIIFYQLNGSAISHKLPYHARIDFYGAFFRFVEMGVLKENTLHEILLTNSTQDLSSYPITRIDYAQDFFYDKYKSCIPSPKKLLNGLNANTKFKNHGTGDGLVNSWSVGSKESGRYVIRLYDKKEDLSVKGKFWYYGDYMNYETVHRLEFQFNSHFCRGYSLLTLPDLFRKIHQLLHTSNYDGLVFYKYDPTKDIITDEQKIRYFKIFSSKAKKISQSGYNPFIITWNALQEKLSECTNKAQERAVLHNNLKLLAQAILNIPDKYQIKRNKIFEDQLTDKKLQRIY